MSRRNAELFLLIAATFPVVLLYAMYMSTIGHDITFQTLAVPLGLFAAFTAAHIAVRIFAPGADPAILPITYLLSGLGITFVTRVDADLAMSQLIILFISIALLVGTLIVVRNLDVVKRYKYTFGAAAIILLLLPMVPGLGTEIYGSRIWIKIGSFGLQPGEFAKICLVLFLAGYLSENRELLSLSNRSILGIKLPRPRLLLPLLIIWLACLGVVALEKDFGSALLFYTVFLIMLYVATGRPFYVILGLGLLAVGGVLLYHTMGHVQVRFNTWMNPFADAQDTGFQLVQSIYSLADGGLAGAGIGKGLAATYVPVVESDFIFSAIGEEMGLLGGAAVLLGFMLFAVRGITTAARAKSDLSAFSAAGLTAAISFQAFLIVGGVTRLIPLTGVTLPFMSQGGSSLLASFIIVGLLMRAGDEATGRERDLAGTGIMTTPVAASATGVSSAGTRIYGASPASTGGSHARPGSRLRRRTLDTPESGVLGRVALAKRLTREMGLFALLFAVLIGNLTYIQVIKAKDYQDMAGNNHTIIKASHIKRGSIITSDGVTLAESLQQEDGTFVRSHPNGNLAAHAVGYYSQQYGTSGIEASQNETLTGSVDYSSWQNALSSLAGVAQPGNSVVLTIDSRIQTAAEQALQGLTGAIVVLDPKTGAVLAWASSPSYDNNDVAATMASSQDGSSGALFDRATQGLYTPGSTFKVVTLSAALDSGVATLDSTFDANSPRNIGGADVINHGNTSLGTLTLRRAFAYSSSVVFGQLAGTVGAESLVHYARAFGYGQSLGLDFETASSIMPNPSEMTDWELAWAGAGQPVGQGHTPGPQTTPMQNAVIAATIANGGIAMNPYVVSQTLSPEGTVVRTTQPRSLGQTISTDAASKVAEAMRDVVNSGTGGAAAVSGVQVAGKTGTAEVQGSNINSAFIGFAPYDSPTLAISVMVEDYKEGGSGPSAAALAGKVLASALAVQGM